jgi:hypothetical protein
VKIACYKTIVEHINLREGETATFSKRSLFIPGLFVTGFALGELSRWTVSYS